MKKRNKTLSLILVFSLSIIFSCSENRKITNDLVIEDWDYATFEFIKDSCGLDRLDSLSIPSVSFDTQIFNSLKEQIKYRLSIRKSLLKFLNKDPQISVGKNELRLIEFYHNKPTIILIADDTTSYTLTYKNYLDIENPNIKLTQSYKEWFDDTNCVSDLKLDVCTGVTISTIISRDKLGVFHYKHFQMSIF